MNLIDNQDRSKLSEGRNWGIGFAFCLRDADTLRTIMPVSCCRDYLNDVVYSEATGKPFQAYGLETSKNGIFTDAAYLVMGIMPFNRTTTLCSNHATLEAALMAPETSIAAILRPIEAAFGFSPSRFEKASENRMVAIIDLKWVKGTYLISLWSLLVRVGLKFKTTSETTSLDEALAFLASVSNEDAYMAKAAIPKIKRMATGDIPVQDLNSLTNVHNMGILTYEFPLKP